MKKYIKPEIETLALETVDVITASGPVAAKLETLIAGNAAGASNAGAYTTDDLKTFTATWQW